MEPSSLQVLLWGRARDVKTSACQVDPLAGYAMATSSRLDVRSRISIAETHYSPRVGRRQLTPFGRNHLINIPSIRLKKAFKRRVFDLSRTMHLIIL
jgi:hypothetical protein